MPLFILIKHCLETQAIPYSQNHKYNVKSYMLSAPTVSGLFRKDILLRTWFILQVLFLKNEADLVELQTDVFCDKATYSKVAELLFLCCSIASAALSS